MSKKNESQEVEVKVEESAPAERVNVIKLEKNDDIESFANKVNEKRTALVKSYKKTNTLNSILMFVVAAVFVGSFILVSQNVLWGQISGWSLIGVTLVGLVTYFLLTRKRYPNLFYFHQRIREKISKSF